MKEGAQVTTTEPRLAKPKHRAIVIPAILSIVMDRNRHSTASTAPLSPLALMAAEKIVSERLGHTNIGITWDTYSHVMPGMQEDAADRVNQALVLALSAQIGASK